jgi:hypothetical protein
MTVRSSWPTYLLTDIPEDVRAAISQEAAELDLSVAEVVRRILCARYEMECEPVARTSRQPDLGARTFLLRVHPDLFDAIKQDAAEREVTMKAVIMEALRAHYPQEVVT